VNFALQPKAKTSYLLSAHSSNTGTAFTKNVNALCTTDAVIVVNTQLTKESNGIDISVIPQTTEPTMMMLAFQPILATLQYLT
jgi:hypothetical protein